MSEKRDAKILQLLADGKSERQVAKLVGCSPTTVGNVRKRDEASRQSIDRMLSEETLRTRAALAPVARPADEYSAELLGEVLAGLTGAISAHGLRAITTALTSQDTLIALKGVSAATDVIKALDPIHKARAQAAETREEYDDGSVNLVAGDGDLLGDGDGERGAHGHESGVA